MLVVFGLGALFLRCGIHPGGGVDMLLPAVLRFPKPVSVVSEAVLPISILRVLHIKSLAQWTILFLILTLALAIAFLWIISNKERKWRNLLLIGFIFSPVTFELLNNVGIFDIFTILGWFLFLSRKSKSRWILGVILLSFTNTPQVPISVLILVIYYIANREMWLRTRLITLAIVSIPGFLFVELWLRINGVTGFVDPSKNLLNFLGDSAYQFFTHFPNSLFSCYGVFWAPILLYIFSASGFRRFLLFSSLILIPLFFAIVVVDATRVFTNLVFPVACLAINSYFKSLDAESLRNQEPIWILVSIFAPINWYGAGLFHRPFTGYLGIWNEVIKPHSNCLGSNLTSLQRDACLFFKQL